MFLLQLIDLLGQFVVQNLLLLELRLFQIPIVLHIFQFLLQIFDFQVFFLL